MYIKYGGPLVKQQPNTLTALGRIEKMLKELPDTIADTLERRTPKTGRQEPPQTVPGIPAGPSKPTVASRAHKATSPDRYKTVSPPETLPDVQAIFVQNETLAIPLAIILYNLNDCVAHDSECGFVMVNLDDPPERSLTPLPIVTLSGGFIRAKSRRPSTNATIANSDLIWRLYSGQITQAVNQCYGQSYG